MSDASEPGEIKSPELSTLVRTKRVPDDKRSYKADKKMRLEKDYGKVYSREEYRRSEEYRREERPVSYDSSKERAGEYVRDSKERAGEYARGREDRYREYEREERVHREERVQEERGTEERERGLREDRGSREDRMREVRPREYERVREYELDSRKEQYDRKDTLEGGFSGKRISFKDDKALRKEDYKERDTKEDKRAVSKDRAKFREEKLKRRSEEERADKLKVSKEEELREQIRNIKEEISKSEIKREPRLSPTSSSSEKKEKREKKDPEKKKKKDSKKSKEKLRSSQDKYEKLLKERLAAAEASPASPEEVQMEVVPAAVEEVAAGPVTSYPAVSSMVPPPSLAPVPPKKKSLLIDSSESSGSEDSDAEMVAGEPSPVPARPTPSPSPPPDPLAGLPPYYPALQGCRNVDHFEYLNRIEEGTYGVVFRARDKRTNEHVALKKLKMEKEKQGFPITSLREINTLLRGQHEHVVHVREIVVGSNMDKIYIVMDYVEHDLKSLMENMKEPFLIGEVKTIMRQLMSGLAFLHDNWIIHRDIKTSNLLFSHGGILKIGDFGLAREYGSPLKQYTEIVVTLWYRAPELLLGKKLYSTMIDVWSAGCVFGELLGQKPLFPGKSEIDQLNKIFKELGTPNEKIWPGYSELPATQRVSFVNHPYNKIRNRFPPSLLSEQGFTLLNTLLCYDPDKRISAADSMEHRWFKEAPLPVDPSMFPTWPAKSEMNANPKKKVKSPTPPSGGGAADKLENSGFKFLTAMQGSSAKGPGFSLKF